MEPSGFRLRPDSEIARGVTTVLAALTITACHMGGVQAGDSRKGHITARPSATTTTLSPGAHRIALRQGREGVLQVPAADATRALPLLVLFHGAGGSASDVFRLLDTEVISSEAVIFAPDAQGPTWDALTMEPRTILDLPDVLTGTRRLMGFGPDVAFLDEALAHVFSTVAIDPNRIAVGGFSDGASYAISLGLINGELFQRIVAFSPGFIRPGDRSGRPALFISHGKRDEVLPFDRAGRRIAQQLAESDYAVTMREFDGGHEVPRALGREGLRWAVDPRSAPSAGRDH